MLLLLLFLAWGGWEKSLPFRTDAGAPEGVAIPTCRASWIPSLHAPLSARGNPRISVLIRAAAACRRRPLLEGAALVLGDPGFLVRGGTSSEGASVERHHLLVILSLFFLVSFPFCWACSRCCPSTLLFGTLVWCGCFIYKAGRKPVSRNIRVLTK